MSGAKWVELGALWKRKDGKPGLTGTIGQRARMVVQQNDRKRPGSKDPDYYLFVMPVEPETKDPPPREPGSDDGGLP